MKKLGFVFLMPIIIGIALIVAGAVNSSASCSYAGVAVLFGGSFAVALITSIVAVVRGIKSADTSVGSSSTLHEKSEDDDIDGDNDDENCDDEDDISIDAYKSANELKREQAEQMIKHSASAFKHASGKQKALGCLIVVSFMGFAVAGMILMSLDYIAAGIPVFACSFGVIFICLIVSKIQERMSYRETGGHSRSDAERCIGTVKKCESFSMLYDSDNLHDIYKLQVDIGGNIYSATVSEHYEEDQRVRVLYFKNTGHIIVLGKYIGFDAEDCMCDTVEKEYDPLFDGIDVIMEKERALIRLVGDLKMIIAQKTVALGSVMPPPKQENKTPDPPVSSFGTAENSADAVGGTGNSLPPHKPNVGYKGIKRR